MGTVLNIGMIGLDTSHVSAFAKLLNDSQHEYHVPGGRVTAAYPGGSPDFELSWSRLPGFRKELTEAYDVKIVSEPEAVAEQCDAILLMSVDGRVHLEQLRRIAPFRRPVFVDKPFAVNSADAGQMAELAGKFDFPLMSCSALRYAEALTQALGSSEHGEIIGADYYGPMELQPTQPGFYWYGIHTAEMLYRTLGIGCRSVQVTTSENHDQVTGVWADGRVGTLRGNRRGNKTFGGLVHREKNTSFVDPYAYAKPYYASLLERIMQLFRDGRPDIAMGETLEIIRFLEAANESRETGRAVAL
ncbi:gfo/Idh/MocA family oxidoreductase [Paenibacillus filicis]|uniref:Gfo/Idh/MocA family oxidoreductase n=1 Tax=Paenibacillus gyeongsangnamensis TaxID=3388067 RepID=A0ABT4QJN3_9BACL|nr:Gfo/Idh/MocA family oxidoreductase [Paenibacillus filicis]MCZ8516910.1 gfo/Idh/MocA family oxidoreductase [Paenibacillus filicis]